MKFITKKDEAVSPVIGTILLVAITVVLVAIIAAVVMPMVSGVSASHVTGIQVDKGAGTVTFTSGEIPKNISVSGTYVKWNSTHKPEEGKLALGTVYKIEATNDDQVSIVATYSDGTNQVIWTGKISKNTSP